MVETVVWEGCKDFNSHEGWCLGGLQKWAATQTAGGRATHQEDAPRQPRHGLVPAATKKVNNASHLRCLVHLSTQVPSSMAKGATLDTATSLPRDSGGTGGGRLDLPDNLDDVFAGLSFGDGSSGGGGGHEGALRPRRWGEQGWRQGRSGWYGRGGEGQW
eukprot:363906-Chlamydomonas_euryale.AAC.4